MGSVLESRESSKNEDGKTDIIYKTMYANSEDFQVLAQTVDKALLLQGFAIVGTAFLI